ncbi:MAG: spore coat protein CotJB [Bacillota bacterium]|jgi:spore coat protein JB
MMMTRDQLLQKITALDFYIIDMHLYLNTHPDDSEALMLYNDCVMQVKELREEYTRSYGMLLANNSTSKQPWQWIDNPWPWQKAFNFELKEDMG